MHSEWLHQWSMVVITVASMPSDGKQVGAAWTWTHGENVNCETAPVSHLIDRALGDHLYHHLIPLRPTLTPAQLAIGVTAGL